MTSSDPPQSTEPRRCPLNPFPTVKAENTAWYVLLGLAIMLLLLRLVALEADFYPHIDLVRDGVLYTDEGWYANNAIAWARWGDWYNEGDMNFGPSLPVGQLFHAFFFSLFGVSAWAARLTSALAFLASCTMGYFLMRRFADRWTSLLALLLLASSFFFFNYSRLALAENLVQAFLLGAAWLALKSGEDRFGYLWAALSGLCFIAAILAKTSGIAAGPALGLIFLLAGRTWRRRILAPTLAFSVAGVILVAHRLWVRTYFPIDVAFFSSINLGMNMDLSRVFETLDRTFSRLRRVDRLIYYFLYYMMVPLLVIFRSRAFFLSPVVWVSVLFIAAYLGAFSLYANVQPRYWAAISVPMAMLIAFVAKGAWELALSRKWLVWVFPVFMGALVISFGQNLFQLGRYYADLRYSFRDMSRDVKERMEEHDGVPHVLLGHFSTTVALFEDVRFVNDIYGADPLEYRVRLYRPQFMITEDVYTEDTHRRGPVIRGEPQYGERVDVVDHFYEVEELASYDVFRNYKDYQIHFYRLHERDGVEWEVPEDYPTELREVPIPPSPRTRDINLREEDE